MNQSASVPSGYTGSGASTAPRAPESNTFVAFNQLDATLNALFDAASSLRDSLERGGALRQSLPDTGNTKLPGERVSSSGIVTRISQATGQSSSVASVLADIIGRLDV